VADRVDWWQIHHVEAELGELRKCLAHPLQAAPRAGKELVPGSEARPDPIDLDRERLRQAHGAMAFLLAFDRREQLRAESDVVLCGLGDRLALDLSERMFDEGAVLLRLRAFGRGVQEQRAL
jgi:hypothetical protein